ncbi:YbhB/YbcL family Raf kinase inhibitor-like protein [Sphingomonas sp. BIUV-7]|uniref:YbhB/YbcL family Raf kinase inhibitor-like protein n=1 Tax=Sphingomonas natans TaxID=3063330 RepID=A0ABT8YAK3_9SPHN|nr:YbhB/YbcL family Raf kinase inhibitor-like protein [Sphingomonas sp. BIUV-7]MDO6414749.1 YbhB/YbcL family Raf kinase inhibitor-like protein [Sphingomonas sp. BIUV-7]
MLEHIPSWIGGLLSNIRAGHARLVIVDPGLALGDATIDLSSPAFASGARLPERFTADGAGVSPPLVWGDVPPGTASLALIVEDPDAPATHPLTHAIIWDLPPDERRLAEGAIVADGAGSADGRDVGRNSYLREGWLPPDPPNGHGSHDYVFQLFALSETPDIGANPGRSGFLRAIEGRILGAGLLVGTYSRGEQEPIRGYELPGDAALA